MTRYLHQWFLQGFFQSVPPPLAVSHVRHGMSMVARVWLGDGGQPLHTSFVAQHVPAWQPPTWDDRPHLHKSSTPPIAPREAVLKSQRVFLSYQPAIPKFSSILARLVAFRHNDWKHRGPRLGYRFLRHREGGSRLLQLLVRLSFIQRSSCSILSWC